MAGLLDIFARGAGAEWQHDGAPRPRTCDHPGCAAEGGYRAPRSPDSLNSYYWFCLDHVRRYNAAWNFFAGMSRHEIEAFQHADLTGHRPTWRFGTRLSTRVFWSKVRLDDPLGLFGDAERDEAAIRHRVPDSERDALAVLDLPATAEPREIKSRYKKLVKDLHPDVNGRDKLAEERLRVVIEAYRLLARRHAAARL